MVDKNSVGMNDNTQRIVVENCDDGVRVSVCKNEEIVAYPIEEWLEKANPLPESIEEESSVSRESVQPLPHEFASQPVYFFSKVAHFKVPEDTKVETFWLEYKVVKTEEQEEDHYAKNMKVSLIQRQQDLRVRPEIKKAFDLKTSTYLKEHKSHCFKIRGACFECVKCRSIMPRSCRLQHLKRCISNSKQRKNEDAKRLWRKIIHNHFY